MYIIKFCLSLLHYLLKCSQYATYDSVKYTFTTNNTSITIKCMLYEVAGMVDRSKYIHSGGIIEK